MYKNDNNHQEKKEISKTRQEKKEISKTHQIKKEICEKII